MTTVTQTREPVIILNAVSWETYLRLMDDMGEHRGKRFTYTQSSLQIRELTARHEVANRSLARLVTFLGEGFEIDHDDLGSTTFLRPDLQMGFEPDTCFYIRNVGAVRGRMEIDLLVDPPPDLVIEIHDYPYALNRLPIFAAFGVPEVWRYDGQQVSFHRLEGDRYEEVMDSLAFPLLTSDDATRFLQDSLTLESTTWYKRLREWIRAQSS